jgi:hypothetical protein
MGRSRLTVPECDCLDRGGRAQAELEEKSEGFSLRVCVPLWLLSPRKLRQHRWNTSHLGKRDLGEYEKAP